VQFAEIDSSLLREMPREDYSLPEIIYCEYYEWIYILQQCRIVIFLTSHRDALKPCFGKMESVNNIHSKKLKEGSYLQDLHVDGRM
jgi:hypothetical protein